MHSDEIVGSFWVPESVDHKVFGLLKVDGDNRTTLYLYDWPIPCNSSNQELNYRFSQNNIPSIIGHLENGKGVVLRNSRYSGFHSQGLEKFTFSVEFITYDIDTECDVHNEFSYNKWISNSLTSIRLLESE